ncbi:alpha/beta fold hydrolase [Kordia zhangzhouensis]|uniref:alpha/beta fold hydrolase n=1 Tax=Kordia zhangzhouensis TaxID=1620405 RepID=UPI0006292B4D|nr:alpha/beta fold hydrolase [Kordia zhangzhouensis]
MNTKKTIISILCAFVMTTFFTLTHAQDVTFETTDSFYEGVKSLEKEDITWAVLTIPENWDAPKKRKIQLAVSILKNKSGKKEADAVVFIQGGPGDKSVENLWSWLDHPLRETNDIVLFDLRGTGLSKPRLCKNLGEEFFQILSKDQSPAEDEQQKIAAVLECKEDLINRGIDIEAYNSTSIAKDIHALKQSLPYQKWNVYGVSYGTYMSQVYASMFPEDINSLILDSSISDIKTYYAENTSNYMQSLSKVFSACENDEACNKAYPDIEKTYYEVIADLEKQPLTVPVSKEILASGQFTFNAEDFKIAIQQALYNKKFVEVLPLLIYEFKNRNETVLGNLIPSFSSMLSMDYGMYYCVSCTETLPNNSLDAYKKDVAKYGKLANGLAFYKSDFSVCDKWNTGKVDSLYSSHDLSNLKEAAYPVLVFAGAYDPITPASNGKATVSKFANGYEVKANAYGHVPSLSNIGDQVVANFIKDPSKAPKADMFESDASLTMVQGITSNKGVANMGTMFSQWDPMLWLPLALAVGLMISFIIAHSIRLMKQRQMKLSDKVIRILNVITSTLGIITFGGLLYAIMDMSGSNSFALAFGLPERYDFLFTIMLVFVVILAISTLYFFISMKKLKDRSILFSVLFSNMLIATYFFYWGMISL